MLCRDGYAVGYSYQARQPFWVGYKLTTMSVAKKVERYDDFRPDPQIPEPYQSKLDDYRKSGYDRGHLAPYASMDFTYEAGNQSFLLSNISPQRPGFNRQGWRYIEAYVRAWAAEREEIYVFTGPLFERDIGHVGDGILIPSHFWKAAYDPEDQQMIAFLVPHVDFSKEDIPHCRVSVDELEQRAGMDFFSIIDDEIENELEKWASPMW